MIRKLQAYVNDEGIKIEHIEKAAESDSLEFSYFGVAQMVTNFGQSEVRFVIPASSLEEAFANYEEELKKFSDEMKKQISERQAAAQKKQAESTATSVEGTVMNAQPAD